MKLLLLLGSQTTLQTNKGLLTRGPGNTGKGQEAPQSLLQSVLKDRNTPVLSLCRKDKHFRVPSGLELVTISGLF